jgi:hypothetical protein
MLKQIVNQILLGSRRLIIQKKVRKTVVLKLKTFWTNSKMLATLRHSSAPPICIFRKVLPRETHQPYHPIHICILLPATITSCICIPTQYILFLGNFSFINFHYTHSNSPFHAFILYRYREMPPLKKPSGTESKNDKLIFPITLLSYRCVRE